MQPVGPGAEAVGAVAGRGDGEHRGADIDAAVAAALGPPAVADVDVDVAIAGRLQAALLDGIGHREDRGLVHLGAERVPRVEAHRRRRGGGMAVYAEAAPKAPPGQDNGTGSPGPNPGATRGASAMAASSRPARSKIAAAIAPERLRPRWGRAGKSDRHESLPTPSQAERAPRGARSAFHRDARQAGQ